MGTNNDSDEATDDPNETGGSREMGVDIGELADELESHEYPATTDELVSEYGDYEIEMSGSTQTLEDVLGGEELADQEYHSAEDVRQMILNMVGDEAVGREDYTDRGTGHHEGEDEDEETL